MPLLEARLDSIGIDKLALYNLDDDLERSDSIGPYRKSFLYLVTRALEEESNVPLVGMQRGVEPIIRQHKASKGKAVDVR